MEGVLSEEMIVHSKCGRGVPHLIPGQHRDQDVPSSKLHSVLESPGECSSGCC